MIQQTSLSAYSDLIDSGQLSRMQEKVLDIISLFGPITNNIIACKLDLPINCVTPRTRELVIKGLVEQKRKVKQANNKLAICWGIKNN